MLLGTISIPTREFESHTGTNKSNFPPHKNMVDFGAEKQCHDFSKALRRLRFWGAWFARVPTEKSQRLVLDSVAESWKLVHIGQTGRE